ncbi:MAG: DNA-directed RNA polymerase subunit beta' [Sumerlaeia bacterium]
MLETTNGNGAASAPTKTDTTYRTISVGMEGAMEDVNLNDVSAVARISLASPEQILEWARRHRRQTERTIDEQEQRSFGEVKKPETINYRTFKPEKDGLFCERIFGPTKDWECACGKYKRIKYKGIICDRCGVEVTESKVRRVRMGYIQLAAPVVHIWFYKGTSSKISNLLDISVRDLQKVIYFQEYVIVDADEETGLKAKEVITEEQKQKYEEQFGDKVKIMIGAEAVLEFLKRLDIEDIANLLQVEMREATSAQKRNKIIKRLKVIEAFRGSPNKPEWMIMETLPVIPPDLRPLVHLDGGRFATSDLNDLYRRVINRNNRLKRLIELRAPDVILRNEKRMLQEAVDALFDNSRRTRPTKGHNNRPLKSLSDMLKGKQGRFRQNLLGKRVDYSGRSVIVVGPELKFSECGLPKRMALELFDPFIIRELEKRGYCTTIKSAKKMMEREDPVVYDILDDIIKDHPVLLNRAPTLHRLGVQAFMPRLVEGKAIRLHPLACAAFNADFDGDQMAVHVPLGVEARLESKMLMLAENNILAPASGKPIATPSQDIVLGCFYLTKLKHNNEKGEYREYRREKSKKKAEIKPYNRKALDRARDEDPKFDDKTELIYRTGMYSSPQEAIQAYEHRQVTLHAEIHVRFKNYGPAKETRFAYTSVGRLLFAEHLPAEIDFLANANEVMTKKNLGKVAMLAHERVGNKRTAAVLDAIKNLGFKHANLGGLSICIKDMKIPETKSTFLVRGQGILERINKDYAEGNLTDIERYQRVISNWTEVTEDVTKDLMETLANDQEGFNPIFAMSHSGARGNKDQIRQLAGMRGLMQRPTKKLSGSIGEIIESPILASFREGLTVLEYFISTHGARKGLADTALKTSDAGYLTRRLVDAAQDLIITEADCGTRNGILARPIVDVDVKGEKIIEPLTERIVGRTPVTDVKDPNTGKILVRRNELITEEIATNIQEAGIGELMIRSVLTCETRRGICRSCYGRDMATGRMIPFGEAVGVVAAQSIGEPGTQLTLRTFHTGGVTMGAGPEGYYQSDTTGHIEYRTMKFMEAEDGTRFVTNRTGMIKVFDKQGNEVQTLSNIPYGAKLLKKDKGSVKPEERIVEWDPNSSPVLAEHNGILGYEDIVEGVTMRQDFDPDTENRQNIITEHREERHPRLVIFKDDGGDIAVNEDGVPIILANYALSAGTIINREAMEGANVKAGQTLARIPRTRSKSRDITGGLPRVDELFEARKPKECAFIADIDGIFELRGVAKGQRKCAIVAENNDEHTYSIPLNRNFLVRDGDRVQVGDVLTDGSLSPHDILRVKGEKAVMEFLLQEIQEVYRLQGVKLNDKHIECIVRQMLKKVVIEDPGNTRFLYGQQVDRWFFQEENERVVTNGGQAAVGKPKLLGLTKASLETESFISAASFQETTRVLTDAAIRGRKDYLRGLKENVIMGLLIPAGTGLPRYRNVEVETTEKPEEIEDPDDYVNVD